MKLCDVKLKTSENVARAKVRRDSYVESVSSTDRYIASSRAVALDVSTTKRNEILGLK